MPRAHGGAVRKKAERLFPPRAFLRKQWKSTKDADHRRPRPPGHQIPVPDHLYLWHSFAVLHNPRDRRNTARE